MSAVIPRLRVLRPGVLAMWCPGCMKPHPIDVHGLNRDGKVIGWDGDHERPTVEPTPSLLWSYWSVVTK